MQTVLKIVITILLFGVLILIHELGHFLVALWSKVKINEFAIGMGPAILKKEHKGILYSLRAFPIGGYVQMDGEDGEGEDENSFNKKPKWKRFLILIAGVFNNIIFGFLLICLIYGTAKDYRLYPTTIIAEFDKNAVSSESGLKEKDQIYSINGYRIYTYTDLSYACTKDGTKPMNMVVIRNGQKTNVENVSMLVEKSDYAGEYYQLDFTVYGTEKTVFSTIGYSFKSTISLSRSIYSFIGSLFTGSANLNNVSGPIGITQVIGEEVATEKGIDFQSLFLMMAMISINLGIVNLLPFPALDGGRIVILLYEAIFKRKLSPKVEAAINAGGFALLMILMVLITVKDIVHLF